MPLRLRLTFLFTLLVIIILGLVCTSIYYFSATARINTIKKRLTNRAVTTARLLSQSEVFTHELIQRIDSSTTVALKNKAVIAYNYKNIPIYQYREGAQESLTIDNTLLDEARIQGRVYFTDKGREAVAYHYTDNKVRMVLVVSGEDEEGKEYLHHLAAILLFSFLGGVVIGAAGGYFFSKKLVWPLKNIADDVAEISAQNLARRIQMGHSKDEWQYLSQTLNDLLNRLQESFDLQKRFIANASHELSTPLTSISSQLEVCLQRERGAHDYKMVMNSIYQDVRQMSKLTQTLLEFAKASGAPGGIELNSLRIDELLLRLPAEMAKADKKYSVVLSFEALPEDEENLLVFGNEELLFTAIKNITHNACKYSDDHQAKILLSVPDRQVKVVIHNSGKGIPEQEIANIFQPFYRVDESLATKGFGLGLPLAYRIIKLHQGTISVDSAALKETSFTIILPQAASFKKA